MRWSIKSFHIPHISEDDRDHQDVVTKRINIARSDTLAECAIKTALGDRRQRERIRDG